MSTASTNLQNIDWKEKPDHHSTNKLTICFHSMNEKADGKKSNHPVKEIKKQNFYLKEKRKAAT